MSAAEPPILPPATADQIAYLKRLCLRSGKTDLQACAIVGKADFEDLTRLEASKIIGAIKTPVSADRKGEPEGKPRFPTPLAIRRIVESGEKTPLEFDEHARWVVENVRFALQVKELAGAGATSAPSPTGINKGGDIKMADLLAHFKTWDALARAFDVTVPTAKAWGEILPASRAYEAEVKTAGFVTAHRRQP